MTTTLFTKTISDVKIKKLKLQATFLRKIADAFKNEQVRALLIKWQGKKYNKRLLNALREIDEHFYIDSTYSSIYLEYNFYSWQERSFQDEEYGSVYVDDYKFNVMTLGYNKEVFTEINDKINNIIKIYENSYNQIIEQINDIESIIGQYNTLAQRMNELNNNTHYMIRHEFDM